MFFFSVSLYLKYRKGVFRIFLNIQIFHLKAAKELK